MLLLVKSKHGSRETAQWAVCILDPRFNLWHSYPTPLARRQGSPQAMLGVSRSRKGEESGRIEKRKGREERRRKQEESKQEGTILRYPKENPGLLFRADFFLPDHGTS